MKNVNAKIFAFKYALLKRLNASIEKDKNAMKEGAKITFENYCKIQLVECTKKTYTKEQQAILDKYAEENGIKKQETKYTRIDIDNIPNEIDERVNKMLETLENNDNDKIITKAASAVAKVTK